MCESRCKCTRVRVQCASEQHDLQQLQTTRLSGRHCNNCKQDDARDVPYRSDGRIDQALQYSLYTVGLAQARPNYECHMHTHRWANWHVPCLNQAYLICLKHIEVIFLLLFTKQNIEYSSSIRNSIFAWMLRSCIPLYCRVINYNHTLKSYSETNICFLFYCFIIIRS